MSLWEVSDILRIHARKVEGTSGAGKTLCVGEILNDVDGKKINTLKRPYLVNQVNERINRSRLVDMNVHLLKVITVTSHPMPESGNVRFLGAGTSGLRPLRLVYR